MEVKKHELVFDGRILHVYRDEVLLDNGILAEREVVKHSGAAAVVPITENGEVILVKQYRYAIGKETLEIPAGLLEPGEEMAQCAARETEEETGFKPMELTHLFDYYASPGYCTECVGVFYGIHVRNFCPGAFCRKSSSSRVGKQVENFNLISASIVFFAMQRVYLKGVAQHLCMRINPFPVGRLLRKDTNVLERCKPEAHLQVQSAAFRRAGRSGSRDSMTAAAPLRRHTVFPLVFDEPSVRHLL